MHNHYIIDGLVEFHPAASTLRNLNDPEKEVVLNSPAGRCLLLLITRNNSIVTQQEFMEIVWEKNGMMVSPNTFYQNISILRKGLKKAGLRKDPVVTIPRVGLTLASDTEIKQRSSENLPATHNVDSQFLNESSIIQETHHDSSLTQIETEQRQIPHSDLVKTHKKKTSTDILKHIDVTHFFTAGMALVAIILLVVISSLNDTQSDQTRYFNNYLFLTNVSGCHVFIADKNATQDEKSQTLNLIETIKTHCANYPWVYVTHYFMLPRISVIRCNKQMNTKNTCISDYYFTGLIKGD